ncbi:MAG: helix-turn-helix domain-containing protein, partial [Candidatus Acidiferrum sp.]
LLLHWSASAKDTNGGTPIKLPLTHEEIAAFIGTTRETVTRTLSEFKSRQLVALEGSTLTISNRSGLEAIGDGDLPSIYARRSARRNSMGRDAANSAPHRSSEV